MTIHGITQGRLRVPVAALLATAGALIAPAGAMAADATVTANDGFAFGNANPTIAVGEKVVWTFANPGVAHNVAATGGNWSFRSGAVSVSHGTHEFTFAAAGSYSYVCELHAPGMAGTVTVLAPGQTPPPPGTPPPGGPPPSVPPPDGQVADTVKPRLSRVSVTGLRRAARVRFRLSETATVTMRIRRGRSARTLRVHAPAGRRSVLVPGLRRARYRIELQARDATGNRSAWRKTSLRIRRPSR